MMQNQKELSIASRAERPCRILDRLEAWAVMHCTKLSECQIPHVGQGSPTAKALGVLVDGKLNAVCSDSQRGQLHPKHIRYSTASWEEEYEEVKPMYLEIGCIS